MGIVNQLSGAIIVTKVLKNTTRVCDKLAVRDASPARQRKIAAVAYEMWMARAFQNGSPQEDWLRAQRAVGQTRLRA